MKLTAAQVKNAKPKDKPYKLSDGHGMYLLVNLNGTKYWRLKYRYSGKEKVLALGVYPRRSLADARKDRDAARTLLDNGIDPSLAKKAKKLAGQQASANSFEVMSKEWFQTKMCDRSKNHQDRTMRALEKDLFPQIGNLPISEITAPDLLTALRKIEARGAIETAHRACTSSDDVRLLGAKTRGDITSVTPC